MVKKSGFLDLETGFTQYVYTIETALKFNVYGVVDTRDSR